MKIYREEKEVKKSWCLNMEESDRDVRIRAVDSKTGEIICCLIGFFSSGKITSTPMSFHALKKEGYDPHEHNNSFNKDGGIVIDDEWKR